MEKILPCHMATWRYRYRNNIAIVNLERNRRYTILNITGLTRNAHRRTWCEFPRLADWRYGRC